MAEDEIRRVFGTVTPPKRKTTTDEIQQVFGQGLGTDKVRVTEEGEGHFDAEGVYHTPAMVVTAPKFPIRQVAEHAIRETFPILDLLEGAKDVGSGVARGLTNLFQPGGPKGDIDEILSLFSPTSEEVPMQVFGQRVNEQSSKTAKIGAKVGDFALGAATSPDIPIAGAVGKAVGEFAQPVIKGVASRIQRVIDPIKETRIGNEGQKLMLWLGGGPYKRMFKEVLKDYDAEVGYQVQRVTNITEDIARETRRIQGSDRMFRDTMEQFAANHGAHPVISLVRKAVTDRSNARVPLNQMNPKQLAATLKQYDNPFGVDPQFIITKADEILQHIDETETLLMKSGVTPTVNKGGANQRLIEPEDWLNQMFGESKPVPTNMVNALLGKVEGGAAHIQQIHEAGIRNFLNDLPKFSEWVKPATGVDVPGWVTIQPGGILGSKLAGYQMPQPLYNALELELTRAGKAIANQPKSEYIIAKDAAEWWAKKVVGFEKKGMVGNPVTQIGNNFGNTFAQGWALDRAGVSVHPTERMEAIHRGFKQAIEMRQGVRSKSVDRLSRYAPNLFQTQVDASISEPAGALGQLEKVRFIPGTNIDFTVPKPQGLTKQFFGEGKVGESVATAGALANKANPVNWFADFQGISEQAYKIATFELLAKKVGDRQAAALVEKYFFDYTDRGMLAEAADRFGLWIFNVFPIKATNLFFEEVINNPGKLYQLKRYRDLAVGNDDPSQNDSLPEWMRKSKFTLPIGGGDYIGVGRMHPFGGVMDQLANLPGTDISTELRNIASKPLATPLINIAQGMQTFTRDDRGNPPLLQPGQPATDLLGLQMKEFAKAYAPTLVGGRGGQSIEASMQGITPTDYPFSEPRSREEAALQYGLGLRTTKAEGKIDKKKRLKSEVKARRTQEVKDVVREAREEAKTRNPMKKATEKFRDYSDAFAEYQKAQTRLKQLQMSGRVVNKERQVTEDGREELRKQVFYVNALRDRAKELKEKSKGGRNVR